MPDTLTIYYERKLSDGAYGSEGLQMGYTVTTFPDEQPEEMLNDGSVRAMVGRLRSAVLSYLAESESPRVAAVAAAELSQKSAGTPSEFRREQKDEVVDMEELPF